MCFILILAIILMIDDDVINIIIEEHKMSFFSLVYTRNLLVNLDL